MSSSVIDLYKTNTNKRKNHLSSVLIEILPRVKIAFTEVN